MNPLAASLSTYISTFPIIISFRSCLFNRRRSSTTVKLHSNRRRNKGTWESLSRLRYWRHHRHRTVTMLRGFILHGRSSATRISPLQHVPRHAPIQRLSIDSTAGCGTHAKQAGTAGTETCGEHGLDHGKGTRIEQLVWLAKQSLATSIATGHKKRRVAKTCTQRCAQPWDGPTVWAHLW
jgi:hypothetical protein